jgi:hypothetical protein
MRDLGSGLWVLGFQVLGFRGLAQPPVKTAVLIEKEAPTRPMSKVELRKLFYFIC